MSGATGWRSLYCYNSVNHFANHKEMKGQFSFLPYLLKGLSQNTLFAGSLVMVIGSNLHNAGMLVYHFLVGRLLGTNYYGDLAALISIFGLLSIIQISFGLTIVKFVASSRDSKEANNLAKWACLFSFWAGLVIMALLFLLSGSIISFLHIKQEEAVYLFIPVVLISFISNTGRALLQGFLRFGQYVTSLIVEVGLKIIFTTILVISGYALLGAMVALLLGTSAGLLTVLFFLRKEFGATGGFPPKLFPMLRYSIPVLIQSLALTSMYSADILLTKHFFPGEAAGLYAALAKLGSIAFFIGNPVASVMFPLVAKRHSHGKRYHKIFYLSVFAVAAISAVVVLGYVFFPGLILGTLFGDGFLGGAPILWWFSFYMFFLGISVLFTQFYLSVGKTRVVLLFAAASFLQILLIWLFHSSLLSVIQVSIVSSALLTISLLMYFPHHHKKK